ncbi:GDP-mannose mannosyl hydrolase [Salinimonas marina]|uniref:GDP-mannose mannosyl hydrolase n=1 Tax=Salinimonas marina TaxID=2785918 RepID=A0A7S9DWA2_9ALTE|nr:GDP-mannose mannosyl hydrolase [Salinimonas marina]QPG05126.1 GDP-mannose mannosyl hydrolase [Salinimonas marina]
MFLPAPTFETVVASTPLVAIDLVVENPQGEVLLGERTNRPAQGYWFVPGGRIQKNEAIKDAFVRLCREELGLSLAYEKACFIGPYEHFYADSIFNEVSTHYVVLAFKIKAQLTLNTLPAAQHGDYAWFSPYQLLQHQRVHPHTKCYFSEVKSSTTM